MDLLGQIDAWAKVAPERVAHLSGDQVLTYGQLALSSDALAAYLLRTLPADECPVGVHGHKEPEMLVAFLGCLKAGHPYVPLDTGLPAQRIERIIETARAPLTLTPERVRAAVKEAEDWPRARGASAAIHYIMFTSGSTGEPKGVPIPRSAVTHFLQWMRAEQRLVAEPEVFLNQVIFSFDVSIMDTFVSLVTGGTLVSLTRDDIGDPRRLYQILARSEISVWVSTPTFAQLCLVERGFGTRMLPRLKRFLFCGETLPPEVAAQLLERFPAAEVWNTYGPTEATVATTSIRIDREILARYPQLPIGHPMPGSRVLVMDERQRPLPPGERGEIVIAGPNVSPGYLHRPDLSARAFFRFEGMQAYRTGDWGIVRDGLLFFEGRMDSQIKLHGHRVELGDVEAHLAALPGVRSAAVVVRVREGRPDSLTAFVTFAEPPEGSDFEISGRLRSALAQRLPAYMIPRRFHVLEAFPMTANGKVDRRKLAERVG